MPDAMRLTRRGHQAIPGPWRPDARLARRPV